MSDPRELPLRITIGQKYEPAMSITDRCEALAYFRLLVDHSMKHGHSRKEAERIERLNLGYYAGYCDHQTRVCVERLFRCEHPYLGKAEPGKPVETAAALWAGVRLAREPLER